MRPICNSILLPLVFAISIREAYPAFNSEEITGETFIARFIGRYDRSKFDNPEMDMKQRELLSAIKALRNPDDSPVFFADDLMEDRVNTGAFEDPIQNYAVAKRPASGKYRYYKCYFNPVTCYRK